MASLPDRFTFAQRAAAVLVWAAAGAALPGCASSGGARASAGPRAMQVDAVALRVVGGRNAQEAITALAPDTGRAGTPVLSASTQDVLARLAEVAEVQVIGRPSVVVTPEKPRQLHMTGSPSEQAAELGFLAGVNTDVRLVLESTSAGRDTMGLKVSGSVLQFTPDKPGAKGGASAANAAYTRLRDFETDLKLRPGQPALVTGPALVEQADGVWTGIVILLTPHEATPAQVAAVETAGDEN